MSQQTNVADLLKNIDMDALVRIMKPSATPDGARQLILPVYNTQVSLKAFPGSKHLTDAQIRQTVEIYKFVGQDSGKLPEELTKREGI